MARIREHNPSKNRLDNPPPLALLPADIVALLDELGRLKTAHGLAATEDANLRTATNADDHTATQADAAAAATAARDGKTVNGATPNRDALVARRDAAAHQTVALAAAIELTRRDLMTASDTHQREGTPDATAATAKAKLDKAGAAFQTALTEAVKAAAVAEWFNGMSYDARVLVHILDLVPNSANTIGPAVLDLPPADASTAIAAIINTLN